MKTKPIQSAAGNPAPPPSVESTPAAPVLIEFIGQSKSHGLPLDGLRHIVLRPNPNHLTDRRCAPDALRLDYGTARITLVGWRLDFLAGELRLRRVARIRVVPEPRSKSTIQQPFVTAMWIRESRGH